MMPSLHPRLSNSAAFEKEFLVMNCRALCVAAAVFLATFAIGKASETTYVATYLDVEPGSIGTGAALIERYVRDTQADMGNLAASAFAEIGRANRFVVIESWKDRESFASHEGAAHTTEFRSKLKAIHRSPFDQRVTHGFEVDPQPGTPAADSVCVVTHVDVPGPRREEAETLLRRLAAPSRADPGHLRYDIYQQDDPRANHFTVFAIWKNSRAFDAYGGTAHWLQFRESIAPILGALYDERLYRPLKR
jgi:quinol monooxygenase YgiN